MTECAAVLARGEYEACRDRCAEAIKKGEYGEDWPILYARSLLTLGEYTAAREVIDSSLSRYSSSVRLRLAAHDVYRRNGDPARAQAMLRDISNMAGRTPWRYSTAPDQVALGRAALLLGADPRQVLELFFDRVKSADAKMRDSYLAAGNLALGKHDYQVAADAFRDGLKQHATDADLHFGLAQAYAPSDSIHATQSLAAALEANPRHIPALLLQAENLMDAEQYALASRTLDQVLAIDHWNPSAWSFQAVLAHLAGHRESEQIFHAMATRFWKTDPSVDHLIGRKLSQDYRFAEGAGYQRRSLRLDPDYLPARIQLAQDLLRLGQEDEGWQLAEEVHDRDRYDVASYNLVTLRDNMRHFRTVKAESIAVRMDPREADLYGDRVLTLLARAKQALCAKYGQDLSGPVTVEIFPRQSDFAVRTFGMPGGAGYLGVCFGNVVTANSPASRGSSPSSWEAVLWHEFCHVVTLQMTRNRMPRWLSEGISVYEERQADPAWGQSMTPQYRTMILGGELTPISKLSGAFLSPKSAMHLQFAYYQSSLVVEYLMGRFGLDTLRLVLRDLAVDEDVYRSLERRCGVAMSEIEVAFDRFARERAEQLTEADLDRGELPRGRAATRETLDAWVRQHPKNFWGLVQFAALLMDNKEWQQAQAPLERAIELFPNYAGSDDPYTMLAKVHRELREPDAERQVLEQLCLRNADAVQALLRLLELSVADKDWPAARRFAERLIAVNPLIPEPHRRLAEVSEALDDRATAVTSYRRVLLLEPEDPAAVQYRLARLLYEMNDPAAKRHVLIALEEAPRYPAALKLLLEISNREAGGPTREPRGDPCLPDGDSP